MRYGYTNFAFTNPELSICYHDFFTFLDKDKWLFVFCHLFVYFDSKTKSVVMVLKQAANFVKKISGFIKARFVKSSDDQIT